MKFFLFRLHINYFLLSIEKTREIAFMQFLFFICTSGSS